MPQPAVSCRGPESTAPPATVATRKPGKLCFPICCSPNELAPTGPLSPDSSPRLRPLAQRARSSARKNDSVPTSTARWRQETTPVRQFQTLSQEFEESLDIRINKQVR